MDLVNNNKCCFLHNNIHLFVCEEPNIEIYRYVKGDIDRLEAEVNVAFYTPINLFIGFCKHQLLLYYFSVSSFWLISPGVWDMQNTDKSR